MSLLIDRELGRFDDTSTTMGVCLAVFQALGDLTALPPYTSLEQLAALDPQQFVPPSPETIQRARSVEAHTALRVLANLDDRELETPTARRRAAALAMDGEPSSQQRRAADAGYRLLGIASAVSLLDSTGQEAVRRFVALPAGQAMLRVLAVSEFGLPFLRLGSPADPFVADLVEPHAGANSAALMELAGSEQLPLARETAALLIPELEPMIRRDAQHVNAVADPRPRGRPPRGGGVPGKSWGRGDPGAATSLPVPGLSVCGPGVARPRPDAHGVTRGCGPLGRPRSS